jgi:hypothetical protein
MMQTAIGMTASSAGMVHQPLCHASGLPRDRRNWQMKPYAAKAANAAGRPDPSPMNMTRTRAKTPRRNVMASCFMAPAHTREVRPPAGEGRAHA